MVWPSWFVDPSLKNVMFIVLPAALVALLGTPSVS
jgi:hypothetical protein